MYAAARLGIRETCLSPREAESFHRRRCFVVPWPGKAAKLNPSPDLFAPRAATLEAERDALIARSDG
jgi:hypothetical protein